MIMIMNSGGVAVGRVRDREAGGSGTNDRTKQQLCQFNCPPTGSQQDSLGEILRQLQPAQGVKRQLDLNIVLSNYIKHRLGKDE